MGRTEQREFWQLEGAGTHSVRSDLQSSATSTGSLSKRHPLESQPEEHKTRHQLKRTRVAEPKNGIAFTE